jgi:hypothetical protein
MECRSQVALGAHILKRGMDYAFCPIAVMLGVHTKNYFERYCSEEVK